MTIELNNYGLMIDLGDFLYVSLSWAFIILTAVILVGVKVYNKIKSNKQVAPIGFNNDDDWMTK
jgi:large-conductance mechanosensitive channel